MHRQRVSGPDVEPVSVEELQKQLRLPPRESEVAELEQQIATAREDCEEYTWRQFLPATWQLELSGFPLCGYVRLPRPPFLSLTSVRYRDADGNEQELDAALYELAHVAGNMAVCLLSGKSWPTTSCSRKAVIVTWVAGWPEPAALPKRYKQAVLLLASDYYRNREARALAAAGDAPMLPPAVRSLLGDRATDW
jgi:uncharacterized phiE125 gp8 family phage protein